MSQLGTSKRFISERSTANRGLTDSLLPENEANDIPLLTWHEVDWQPLIRELTERQDAEGLRVLHVALPRLSESVHHEAVEIIDGKRVTVHTVRRTAESVLNWFRDRRNAINLTSRIQAAVDHPSRSPLEQCRRWHALAEWLYQFEITHQGRRHLVPGEFSDRRAFIGGVRSPSIAWIKAFREATQAVAALMRGQEDVAVHRLVQDLDSVLGGENVSVTEHVREVDVLVRAAAGRAARAVEPATAAATCEPSLPSVGTSCSPIEAGAKALGATVPDDPYQSLYRIAYKLLDAGRVFMDFRTTLSNGGSFIREELMPRHLLEIRAQARNATNGIESLRFALREARDGNRWHGDMAVQIENAQKQSPQKLAEVRDGLLQHLELEIQAAEERARGPLAADQSIKEEWQAEKRRLEDEWRREHHQEIVLRINQFRTELAPHEHRISGIEDLSKYQLGALTRGASSACQVLIMFAEQVADITRHVPEDLDQGGLAVALKKEIGALSRLALIAHPAQAPATSATYPVQGRQAPLRVAAAIDAAGYDLLCTAWDNQDPAHRRLPTWKELAGGVHRQLGLKAKVGSTLTALKQRCPRTRAKWEEIQKEIAEERMTRRR